MGLEQLMRATRERAALRLEASYNVVDNALSTKAAFKYQDSRNPQIIKRLG